MAEREISHVPPGIDPDSSPFAQPPTEGIPFKRGSEEDLAIKRVIEEADAAREAQRAAD